MKIFVETDRLLLRELVPADDKGMFALDSDPEVHWYLGNSPIKTIDDSRVMIAYIRQQYIDNGVGRWAVIEKQSGSFIGWAGLKLMRETINGHVNFYDIGYRLIRQYWGKGYATEAAKAVLDYGFNQLNLDNIYGMTAIDNLASKNVLQKIGLTYVNNFDHAGLRHSWYQLSRKDHQLRPGIASI